VWLFAVAARGRGRRACQVQAHRQGRVHAAQALPALPDRKAQHADGYWGHATNANLASKFVTHLFNSPECAPPKPANPTAPAPALPLFVAYAIHRTRLHHNVVYTALFLLMRLKARLPAAKGSSGHRLFISAFMIASKVACDDTYSNKSWTVVGQGMFALREINQMEREMCGYLERQLGVEGGELATFKRTVEEEYAGRGPYQPFPIAGFVSTAARTGTTPAPPPPRIEGASSAPISIPIPSAGPTPPLSTNNWPA
jgi:hypothetical protein